MLDDAPGGDHVDGIELARLGLRDVEVGRRALVVAVGPSELEAALVARYAALIPARDRRAVHVAVDAQAAHRLGLAWMDGGWADDLRLDIVDDVGGIADTIAAAACDRLNAGFECVVVLAARRARRRTLARWRSIGTGVIVARELARVRGAVPVLLDVPVHRPARRGR